MIEGKRKGRGGIFVRSSRWLPAALLAAAMVPLPFARPAASACHDWPAHVTLSGVIAERMFPGPPNWESIDDGDAALTAIFLDLDAPICLRNGDWELDQEDIDGLAAIHLVPGDFAPMLRTGLRVQVSGTFMESHTGYHQTPALLVVGSVSR